MHLMYRSIPHTLPGVKGIFLKILVRKDAVSIFHAYFICLLLCVNERDGSGRVRLQHEEVKKVVISPE